jgi:hypothetical protein
VVDDRVLREIIIPKKNPEVGKWKKVGIKELHSLWGSYFLMGWQS